MRRSGVVFFLHLHLSSGGLVARTPRTVPSAFLARPSISFSPATTYSSSAVMLARGGRKGKGTKDENIPSKICVTCGRPFTWRKKWERCWDEVQTCSKRCNSERRKNNRLAGGAEEDGEEDGSDAENRRGRRAGMKNVDDGDEEDVRRQEKKAAKKAAKAARRAKREGTAPQGTGQKACQHEGCGRSVDLLVRCQTDASNGQWLLVCGKCWRSVSGGVVDGDAKHPGYRYGGLWKNRHVVNKKKTGAQSPSQSALSSSSSSFCSSSVDESDDEDDRALSALLSAIGT